MSLQDVLSLGAWMMGLGCSGKILQPPKGAGVEESTGFFRMIPIIILNILISQIWKDVGRDLHGTCQQGVN